MCRCRLAALSPILTLLVSCGGDGSSSGTGLPPDLSASISLDIASVTEDPEQNRTVLSVELSEAVQTDVGVSLSMAGEAVLGLDFELEPPSIRVPAGTTHSSVVVTALLDWIAEGPETVTFEIRTLNGRAVKEPGSAVLLIEDSPVPNSSKNIKIIEGPHLGISADVIPSGDRINIKLEVSNTGNEVAAATHVTATVRPIEDSSEVLLSLPSQSVPELAAGGSHSIHHELETSSLPADARYVLVARVMTVAGGGAPAYRSSTAGFGVSSSQNVEVVCRSPNRDAGNGPDPLFPHQWSLVNEGQSAFADEGGKVGADLNLPSSLNSAGTAAVRVAVVDTGLEICHPDLADNIEAGASANLADWPEISTTDPFNPDALGDHGTSVAGIIAAVENNGAGIRGVHPTALLRGYNYLESDQSATEAKALGSSTENPDSSSADIFNMSYGQTGNVQSAHLFGSEKIYEHGVNNLRNGRGAVYVRSSGNGFGNCARIEHDVHRYIGCRGANNDTDANLPEIIVVGALSALDVRAPYSSPGPNLWVSAPAGHYGARFPAVVTTDQAGLDRGYEANRRFRNGTRGLDDHPLNPHGDYVSTFNGTSAAAPHVTGVAALMLAQEPDLTWRDVKYILARSARRVDADRQGIRVVIDGTPMDFRLPWTRNAAGYWFHNWYGFGAADADAALALVREHRPDSLGEGIRSSWYVNDLALDIPDSDGAGVRIPVAVAGVDPSTAIEAVEIRMSFVHDFPSDLAVSLISPSGTRSMIVSPFNDVLSDVYAASDWHQTSNAFFGEPVLGTWVLEVFDVEQGAVGEFLGWKIRFLTGGIPPADS